MQVVATEKLMPRYRLLGVRLVWSGLVVPRWRGDGHGQRQGTVGHKFQSSFHPSPIDHPIYTSEPTQPSSNSIGGAVAVAVAVAICPVVLSLLVYKRLVYLEQSRFYLSTSNAGQCSCATSRRHGRLAPVGTVLGREGLLLSLT
jgi:hypothetical protein